MLTLSNILLVVTATTTALVAGLFYSWSVSVTPGLARLPDAGYIAAMQAMNDAILNPLFFVCFLGSVLLLPLSTYVHYAQLPSLRFWFLLAAAAIYIIGVFGVTILGNVPLNEALKSFPLQAASPQEVAAQRLAFEGPWNQLNVIRTIAAIVAFVFVALACISHKD